MNESLAVFISGIFGLCKRVKFPGTLASFVSLIFSFLSYYFLGRNVYVLLFFFFLILGFFAIRKVHEKNGLGDHQWIGVDEWIGMWLANFFLFELELNLTQAIIFSLISFMIFRIIDISKFVPPIKSINERENQNSSAVLLDDIIGGCYTYFIMLVILRIYDLNFFYSSLLILLPAMIANMTPVLLKTKYLTALINEKIFGKNKTWRGFLGAIIIGTLSFFVLIKLNIIPAPGSLSFILFIGFLFSFGAIGGDLVKSFFKRKAGIQAGESWSPWDQIDYVLGAIILTCFVYQYSFSQIIFMIILGGVTSVLFHRFGHMIKMTSAKQ